MPLTPDVAGELGRYHTMLQQHLNRVHSAQAATKADLLRSQITDELKTRLGQESCDVLGDCLPVLSTETLEAQLLVLADKERALLAAIKLVGARLA